MRKRSVAVAAVASGLLAGAGRAEAPIAYPEGFRRWTHVSSALVTEGGPPKYAGVHHIYANAAALKGLKTGRYADGAVFVYDQWTAVKAGPAALAPGERRFVDVMVRDSRRFAGADGWGYAEFVGPERVREAAIEADPVRACHACHKKLAAPTFVFSRWRD